MSKFLGYDMEPGLIPLVVGVVSTSEGLEKASNNDAWPCDVIEIRLDLIGEDYVEWPSAALRLSKAGIGTILTIRHVSEGGRWKGDEDARLNNYLDNLQHVTGIDVELGSAILPDLLTSAKDRVTVIGSHHNLRGMPTGLELQAVIKKGIASGVDVIKVAAYASDRSELSRLVTLLKKNEGAQICALAMGPMALESRISLPIAGSCLTYGFLDKPSVAGQPSALEIRDQLIVKHEEYRVFTEIRSQLSE